MDQIFESLTGYLEARIKLIRIEIKEEVSQAVARLIIFSIIGLFGFIAFVLLSVGLSLWVGSCVDSAALGFFIVSLFYIVLVALLVWLYNSHKLDNFTKILFNHIFTPKKNTKNDKSE